MTAKIKKIVFFTLIFSGIFIFAKPVYAILGLTEDLWGLLESQLDALDFVDNVLLRYIIWLIVLLLESILFLVTGAAFLEWATSLPINIDNPLVLGGWNFILGLSNLLLVLVFLVIAIAYILKIETFGMKKALPKLFLVALLINFSLVFVKVGVDIAWIIQNSFSNLFGGDFVSLAIEPLKSRALNLLLGYIVIVSGYLVSALIPYANVGYLVFIAILFIGEYFLGTITNTVFLIILNFAVGILFYLYTFLFLARIAMLWLLAIFIPLALVTSILPVTQRFWNRWIHLFTQWLLFGIFGLFLLGLILKSFTLLVQPGSPISPYGFTSIDTFVYNYLLMLVLLAIVFHLSRSYMPQFAQVIVGQAERIGKRGARAMNEVIKPVKTRVTKGVKERLARRGEWAEKTLKTKPTTRRERLKAAVTRPFAAWVVRQTKETEQLELDKAKKKIAKIKDAATLYSTYERALRFGDTTTAIAAVTYAIEEGGAFKKVFEKNLEQKDAISLAKYANRIGAEKEALKIARLFVHRRTALANMGFKISEKDREKYTTKKEKVEGKKLDDATILQRKLFAEAKGDEWKQFNKEFLKEGILTKHLMKDVSLFLKPRQLRKAAEVFGKDFTDAFMKQVNERFEQFFDENPEILFFLATTPAQYLGYSFHLTKKDLLELRRRAREKESRG